MMEEFIRIKSTDKGLRASGRSFALEYLDKDTGMYCVYMPSFELSAYSATIEDAQQMMKDSMMFYFDNLFTLSMKKITAELYSLGWSKKKFKQKEFVPIIDINTRAEEEGIIDYSISELDLSLAA